MSVAVVARVGVGPERGLARLLVRFDPEGLESEPRGLDLEDERERTGGAVEARHGRTAHAALARLPLAVAPGGGAVRGGPPRGVGLGRKRRDLVGHKLLYFVKSGHCKRMGDLAVRGRRPDCKRAEEARAGKQRTS